MRELFPAAVYLLCFGTSSACAWLLMRDYLRTRTRLLLWSSLCFVLLAANNLLVILDLLIFVHVDMRLGRLLLALAAVGILIFGFIWDLEDE